ncbi:hypothetical protein AB205_0081880 [Aquarana catesbeiana]|uniref:Ig-like domain-containing protein n=1 Tax=Aquarana catesbeiana TaxID=8400 RepID=A0A2G9SAV2_AQUCT|nr:hypothetical protein AB205_0081880 [Aquarana catesbeiana]
MCLFAFAIWKKMKTLTRMFSRIHLWLLPVIIITLRFPQSVLSCPHPCACYVNTEVHCTFRSLATVPTRIPKHVERINLGFNSIQSIPENSFVGLSKLEMLLIHSNDVQNIPNGAFRDLNSLQVFKMSYNKLKVITSHTFHGLSSLTRLHIDHNKIDSIHPNAFNGLTALRLLHLEGNLLHQLHPNTFCTFSFLDYFRQSTLKHLYLSDNMLQTLPASMIQTMPLLENLYLHGNPWACDCQLKWLLEWDEQSNGAVMTSSTRIQRFEVLDNGTLHIQNLQLQDRGQYMCTAQNKHGIDKMTVTLAVIANQPKMLSSRYRDILIYLGDTITLDCNATGIPTPHISWILPDRRIVRTVSTAESHIMLLPNGSLSIKEVTFPDRGSYKCVASNVAGADSLTVKLQVSPLPPIIQQEKVENISLPQSHSIFIHCSAKGAPPPTIRWVLSDGTQVRPSQFANGNIFVFPNGTLYIRNSSPRDIGKYECIAANVVGAARRIVHLDVKKYPLNAKITASSPQKTDVSYGGTLRLECSAAGDPWPRIMWRLPSKRLVDSFFSFDSRIKTFANGTLIIYSVTEKDAGDYLCMARNKLGDDYMVLKVNVMMKAAKIQFKNDIDHKVTYGGDLKVDCVATGVPNPEISWSLPDGSMINNVMQSDDSGTRTRRYVVFNNGTLYFNEVGMKEQGDYTCYAVNQVGQDEMRVSVKILPEKPAIKNKTYSIINVPYGDVITVSCEAKGEPVPKITWLSPSSKPIPASSDKYLIYQDGTLLIQKAQRSDSGNYTCLAQNNGGEDKKVVQIQVNVLPPKINGYSDKILTVKQSAMKDTRLLIDCKAEGIPTPRVMWAFPEGVILPAPYYGNRITVHRNGTLDIKVLRKTDSVQLVCIARNEGGEAKLVAQLTVNEPAVKPQFTSENEIVVVSEGHVAKLNCSAVGIPEPHLIWILPNGTEINSGSHLHRLFHKQDGTLHIGSVAMADGGTYRCRALNIAGSADRLVILQIGQKPQMSSNYNNLVSIINGETLQLHCTTQGEPRPHISWTLPNGIVIDRPQVKGRISLLQNGTLIIKDTSVYDRGSYQCKATTQYGSSTMNVPVIVIAYPPRITTSPAPVIYARPGSSIQLNCMSIGIPKAEITWELPDKSQLTAGAQSRLYGNKFLHPQGTLVIQHSSKRDAGYYKCTAKNILGSDTKSTYIHVY